MCVCLEQWLLLFKESQMPLSLDKSLDPQLRKILILKGHNALNDGRQMENRSSEAHQWTS